MFLSSSMLPTIIWLVLMLVLAGAEIVSVNLTTIWFALGALAAMISSLCGANIWLQLIWFLAVSILTLIITKPLVKKFVNSKTQATNADMVIGQTCVVVEPIDNLKATGAVTVGGKTWTARSLDAQVYAPGERVTAVRIEGVKLIVAAPACVKR
jgi:membrane protein implicated in regulation of membrane protease activity